MKQIIQHLNNGVTELMEVPCPAVRAGHVLITSARSLVSPGTERMLMEFGQANLIAKARQQPDKVKQVLDKIRTDGLRPTIEAVFRKLDEPLPMGYCNVGIVDAGQSSKFKVQGSGAEPNPATNSDHSVNSVKKDTPDCCMGDRVVSNGPHAEVVCVPERLCAKIPDGVSDEDASFAVLASVALQGIRIAKAEEGEKVVVFGLGLIGLMAVQILKAMGCDVLGIDLEPDRLKLAEQFGAKVCDAGRSDPVGAVKSWADDAGANAVLITASAKKDEIVHQSAEMCRKYGRIVLVGVVDLNLRRSDFYAKELSFHVSCSYGPDRMQPVSEDNPAPWTVRDNLERILGYMESGKLDVKPLITHRFRFADASKAYEVIREDSSALGVILEYAGSREQGAGSKVVLQEGREGAGRKSDSLPNNQQPTTSNSSAPVVAVIGAGNFVKATLMPALAKTDARIKYVVSQGGTSAAYVARKFGCENALSDYRHVLSDPDVNAVVIATRHDMHAQMVCEALKAGKHVFVEKPLCLTREQLDEIDAAYRGQRTEDGGQGVEVRGQRSEGRGPMSDVRCPISDSAAPTLTVGFNRRFSPHTMKVKDLLAGRYGPLCMTMTVNAGEIPKDHWVHDSRKGGGRIIGEACHFVDLMLDIVSSRYRSEANNQQPATNNQARIVSVTVVAADAEDRMAITLKFADGSVGTVNYFANGSKSYPKETLEVFSDGRVLRVDNFRVTQGYGVQGFRKFKTLRQDKGHATEMARFVDAVTAAGPAPIPFNELVGVTRASFAAVESARTGKIIQLG